ncbi:MAG: DUF2784 domain-containing protein [Candidatus Hydrogenedentes bacterium]|nr:DUF2784 domain-containing protein [Candidatus Hydrogenedentota bacterium]
MYEALNCGFFVFHTVFVLFVLSGWLWRLTRPCHLAACILTAFSWGVLGLRYGFGYCPFTDWHWRVRVQLGEGDMPRSYLKFLLDKITGLDFDAGLVDTSAIVVFAVVSAISLICCVRDWRRKQNSHVTGDCP